MKTEERLTIDVTTRRQGGSCTTGAESWKLEFVFLTFPPIGQDTFQEIVKHIVDTHKCLKCFAGNVQGRPGALLINVEYLYRII